MSDDNKALLRRWFDEVWNQGRVETIDTLLAPDAVVHSATGELPGRESFKTFHAAYRDAFPDAELELEDVIAEGAMVAARWRATCTHLGDGLGIPATGRRIQFTGMVFARIEGGRFVEGWDMFDQVGMLRQIGIITPLPNH